MEQKFCKAAILAAIAVASVSSAQASTTDVLLGFNDAAGPGPANNDYVIDLGYTPAALIAAATSDGGTIDLSSTFSSITFNTAFGNDGNALSDVCAGFVAGNTGVSPKQFYQTYGAGGAPPQPSHAQVVNNSAPDAESAAIGEYVSTTTGGWTYYVAASATSADTDGNGVASSTGNPMGQISAGNLSLTLYETTASGLSGVPTTWADEGTFDIDLNNSGSDVDVITFTTVPEPSTYCVFALGGLLAYAFRRQLTRKVA